MSTSTFGNTPSTNPSPFPARSALIATPLSIPAFSTAPRTNTVSFQSPLTDLSFDTSSATRNPEGKVPQKEAELRATPPSGRSVSAPRSRMTSAPKVDTEKALAKKSPHDWSQKYLRKQRNELSGKLEKLGYRILAVLSTIDESNERAHYAIVLSPKGYYAFVKLQDTLLADEVWSHKNSEEILIFPDALKTYCVEKQLEGMVQINKATICVSQMDHVVGKVISKEFSLAKGHSETDTKVRLGSFYLAPLVTISAILETPDNAEELIFKAIRDIRQGNQQIISEKQERVHEKSAHLKQLLEMLDEQLTLNDQVRTEAISRWREGGNVEFSVMDHNISATQQLNVKGLEKLEEKLTKVNECLDEWLSALRSFNDELEHL